MQLLIKDVTTISMCGVSGVSKYDGEHSVTEIAIQCHVCRRYIYKVRFHGLDNHW